MLNYLKRHNIPVTGQYGVDMRRRQMFAMQREAKAPKPEMSMKELRKAYRAAFGKGCGRMSAESIKEKLNAVQ